MTRFSYSPEDMKTRKYIKKKMRAYGLSVREDGLGNIFGKLEGTLPNAPSVLVGSHYDSVPHGGNYEDRKSTRLNSSHVAISYAVFCVRKKRARGYVSTKK